MNGISWLHRSSIAVLLALGLGLLSGRPVQARVLDDFNDNTKTGWTDFTFVPGFGIPTESNGQLRFEQPQSPSGGGIFSATQKTSEPLELKDGRTIEMRVDVVEGGAKDSFAVLAFIPTAGAGGPGSLAGYGLAKSTTDALITKGINKYFVADDGVTAELKQENITLVLRLTASGGSVTVQAQILDKDANNAVIWDRIVVDTPAADVLADGTDSPAEPFITSGYFTLYLYQDLDMAAVEDPYRVVYDNAQVFITDRSVLDDFDDNTKTGWTDFTFVPGFGIPTESNGQLRFEQPQSPSGGGIFSATQKTSRPFDLVDGEQLTFQVDVVEGGAKDSFAVLAFIPTAGAGGPGSLAGYGFAKSTTDALITKGINKYFVADDGVTAELKQENITLVLRLTASGGSVAVQAQVLDKDADNAVIWDRTVVDTPAADVLADGTDSPAEPFITSGYFTLYLYQDLDMAAVEDPYRVVYDNAVVWASPAPSNLPPEINNVRPGDTDNFLTGVSRVEFTVTDDEAIADEQVAVVLNGTRYTTANGLTLTGTGNTRNGALGGLTANTDYTATIEITDNDGLSASRFLTFDTFAATNPVIEAEDYNFNGGQFINNPVPQPEGSGPDDTGYSAQAGVAGVDFFDTREFPSFADTPWRPSDPVRMARSLDRTRAKHNAAGGANAGVFDYVITDIAAGEWLQYSRNLPAGTYEVYLRQSVANLPSADSALELVTGDPTQPDAATRLLGSFLGSRTGFLSRNVPLTDGSGTRKTVLRVSAGVTTLRLRQITADLPDGSRTLNYLVLVPVPDPGVQRATIASVLPAPGATVETASPVIEVALQNRDTSVNLGSVQLRLNGTQVNATVAATADGASVRYPISPLPAPNALQTASITFQDNEGQTVSDEWQFRVAYTLLDPATRIAGTGKNPGFRVRVVQAPFENGALENSLDRAESQLAANSPIPRIVDTNTVVEVINFNKRPGETAGAVDGDVMVPGIDNDVTGNGDNDFAVEILAYLELPAGVNRFGFITDDGYKVATGRAPVAPGTPPLAFNNGGPANATVDFVVAQAGLYAFRMVWYERAGSGHGEWTSINPASGERLLINGTSAQAIKAWTEFDAVAEEFVLESSATVAGGYAVDATAVVNSAARTVTVPLSGGPRFFRLRAGSAVTLANPRIQGANLTFTWQ
jgi:hypothetical protein